MCVCLFFFFPTFFFSLPGVKCGVVLLCGVFYSVYHNRVHFFVLAGSVLLQCFFFCLRVKCSGMLCARQKGGLIRGDVRFRVCEGGIVFRVFGEGFWVLNAVKGLAFVEPKQWH